MPVFVFTAITMIAFALNSVFARLALLDGAIDEASYTSVRIIAGAAMLAFLIILGRKKNLKAVINGGNWVLRPRYLPMRSRCHLPMWVSKPVLAH